jgi:hypothetical protein
LTRIILNQIKQIQNHDPKKALTINNEAVDRHLILDYCEKNNVLLDVEVYDRIRNPIKYLDMPNFLRKYDTYLDVKIINGRIVRGMSKTTLESLACGLRVINYGLSYLHGPPPEHSPIEAP